MPRRDDDPSRMTVRLDVEAPAAARRPISADGADEEHATGAPPTDASGYRDYAVIGEEARGGLGRVLRARDRRLDRPVALKELLADGTDARARFLREARLTARLQHPSIVPVYEIGLRADGAPFYAMKLIEGEPFDRVIGRTQTLDERLALLPNVIDVAEAIAFAHERRIIHRDLKPSNVVVGEFGETMVVDWGLAKDLDEADGPGPERAAADGADAVGAIDDALGSGLRTRAGDAMGTLAYMSPEQLRCDPVDERTDVFALGAFLYHTLTGTAPYAGLSEVERHQRIRRAEPEPIASREPGVPAELGAIVRKAMAAAPDDRYASAKELAADLKRLQTGQLVSAHVYSRRVLFVRWLSRNRRRVAVGVLFLASLGAVAGLSARRILRERDRAEQERARADARAEQLTLLQARTSLDRDPTASLAWLKTSSLDATSWSEIASIAADARARGVARHVVPVKPSAGIGNGLIAPDGLTGIGSLDSSGIFAIDLRSGRIVQRWPTTSRVATSRASFTADGSHLVSGSEGGEVVDLDLASRSIRMLQGHRGASVVAVAPLGHAAASCGEDGTVRTWDLDSGEMHLAGKLDDPCEALAYGAGGSALATVGRDHRLRIWDLQAGTARVFPLAEGKEGESVTWSPNGKTIVTMDPSNEFHAWDSVEGRARLLAPESARLREGRFFRDGRRFVAWSWDGSVHLWDLEGGGAERVLKGHTAPVEHVEVSTDGSLLVSCSEDATVRLWDLRTFVARVFRGHTGPVMECSISPDHRTLLTAGIDSTVRIWDLGDGRSERALPESDDDLYAVAFSPDGSRVATAGDETVVRVFLTATGEVTPLEGHTGSTDRLAFLGDGSHLASASYDGTVRVWDLATRTAVVLPHEGRVMTIAPTRDGSTIATGSEGGVVRVWDVARREAIAMNGHTGRVDAVALSPDERLVASAGLDGTTRVWDRKSGAPLRILGGDAGPVLAVTFAGDSLVASAAADGNVRVWDVAGNLAHVFEGHHARVRTIVASPDGQRLLTASDDHTVAIWSLSGGEPRVLAGHTDQVKSAVFSRDGRFVVSASYDLTARLWDAQTGRLLDLFRAGDPVMRAAIAPDDGTVAFVGWDRLLHLPSVDPARFLPGEAGGLRAWLDRTTSAAVVEGSAIASPAADVTR